MNQKEIKELIEFLVEKDIAEFELERGDMKLHIKRGTAAQAATVMQVAPMVAPVVSAPMTNGSAVATAAPVPSVTPAPAAAAEPAEEDLVIIKSPIVGTYYESPSPGAPPFIKVGDTVKEGQVLCIIEAMKLMNEIEADASGEIVKMFVPNGSPVEYGMPLFGIRRE
jgi:acetyl-CoA carboxylase biotin carboxyl carrier protein